MTISARSPALSFCSMFAISRVLVPKGQLVEYDQFPRSHFGRQCRPERRPAGLLGHFLPIIAGLRAQTWYHRRPKSVNEYFRAEHDLFPSGAKVCAPRPEPRRASSWKPSLGAGSPGASRSPDAGGVRSPRSRRSHRSGRSLRPDFHPYCKRVPSASLFPPLSPFLQVLRIVK